MLKSVETKYGILESVESRAGYALFRGIPYASPPVGNLRWRPPLPPLPWKGVRKCDSFGAIAPQAPRPLLDETGHAVIVMDGYPYPPRIDEDCLYMNIYTPAETPDEKLPVFLYYHGGGAQEHFGSDYEYCGDGFCKRKVIQITLNYRMNVFGYLVHPELGAENSAGASGNYGTMDQIQGLRFVKENIAAFGGDPDNITIAGQSAGGNSVQTICCSPLAKGLFQHASIHSAPALPLRDRGELEDMGIAFMQSLGCKNIAEMRTLPWQTLEEQSLKNMRRDRIHSFFYMYADGYVLPRNIMESFRNSDNANVDYIMGCTVDEGHDGIRETFGTNIAASMRALAGLQSKAGRKPVYFYCFDRPQPGDSIGTPHSCDIRYLFGTLDGTWRPYEDRDRALSNTMIDYWTQFAGTGNPNTPGQKQWDCYGAKRQEMCLNVNGCAMRNYDSDAMYEAEKRMLGL